MAARSDVPKEKLLQLADDFENELTQHILPFWLKYSANPKNGGFYGLVSGDGVPVEKAARFGLITSRILWTYSTAYIQYKDEKFLTLAKRAYDDLKDTFTDKKHGGIVWSVTADGKPKQPHKQTYQQAFAIYGLSEYYRATGDEKILEDAKTLFDLMERHASDPKYGGYVEWLTHDWKEMPPMLENYLTSFEPKSQNTHLHILEAYTNLLRVWPDERLKNKLRVLLEDVMLGKILNSKTNHLSLFMTEEWKVEGDSISPGHDIEGAWLLLDAANVLGDTELINRVRDLAVKIADATLDSGIDEDGGLFQELSESEGLIRSDKDWWSQAEGLVGFATAFEISGDQKYLSTVERIWDFIKLRFIMKDAEWYMQVKRDGTLYDAPIINPWKCPYHNARAMLEGAAILRKIAAQ